MRSRCVGCDVRIEGMGCGRRKSCLPFPLMWELRLAATMAAAAPLMRAPRLDAANPKTQSCGVPHGWDKLRAIELVRLLSLSLSANTARRILQPATACQLMARWRRPQARRYKARGSQWWQHALARATSLQSRALCRRPASCEQNMLSMDISELVFSRHAELPKDIAWGPVSSSQHCKNVLLATALSLHITCWHLVHD
eukprot:354731-Chlamydomonas_euryale.AAC.13